MQSMFINLTSDRSANRRRGMAAVDYFEYLGNPRAQVASHEIFESFELCLYDDEGKIGLWVHVARHLLDPLDLLLDAVVDALEETIGGPAARGGK